MPRSSRFVAVLIAGVAAAFAVPAAGGAAAPPPAPTWYGYHKDLAHTGYAASTPPFSTFKDKWQSTLDGAVYGQVLVVRSTAIVATENNSVYALNLTTGAVIWRHHLAAPVPRSSLPCGDIDPVGITSTPVYDPGTHRIFVVTDSPTSTSVQHTLVALDPSSGNTLWQRNVDVPGLDPKAMNQRGALAVSHGKVYVPYGGNAGDCGNYKGSVVASQLNGQGSLLTYTVPTTHEAGIWAAGGIPIDSSGNLYVAVGNGGATAPPYDSSDSVTKLSPDLKVVSIFAPAGWAAENASDQDLGSTAPLLVNGEYVWIQGKTSTGYLLKQSNLGGVGHPYRTVTGACAEQFGGAASKGTTVYAACTDGIRKFWIDGSGNVHLKWKSASNITGSPVVGGLVVFTLDVSQGRLFALDTYDGAVRNSVDIPAVSRFASPTLTGNRILVPTMTGVVSFIGV